MRVCLGVLLLLSSVFGGEPTFVTPPILSNRACATPNPSTIVEAVAAPTMQPKGSRLLGIDVYPAANETYDAAFNTAKNAGMQVVPVTLAWTDIETFPGVYNTETLQLIDSYYSTHGVMVSLAINPISTNIVTVPIDLRGRAWDDPALVARFQALLGVVIFYTQHTQFAEIIFGNEVDIALGSNTSVWLSYQSFFKAAVGYSKQYMPLVKFGVTGTYAGYTAFQAQNLYTLNAVTDFVGVTYYAINADYTVKNPSVVYSEWNFLASFYPDRKLHFRENGFPSATQDNSNEPKQKTFIINSFTAWDSLSTQIELCSFLRLTDYSQAYAWQVADQYYPNPTPQFVMYLLSLGMRRVDGVEKPAFTQFKIEAHGRGW